MIYRISPLLPVLAAMWLSTIPAIGQRTSGEPWYLRPKRVNTLSDSINTTAARYSAAMDSLILERRENKLHTAEETLENPYYFPLFSSSTIFGSTLRSELALLPPAKLSFALTGKSLVPPATGAVNRALLHNYASRPYDVKFDLSAPILPPPPHEDSVQEKDDKKLHHSTDMETPEKVVQKGNELQKTFTPGEFHITVRRPNFWTVKGNFSLEFMQYYVTENWYKGGDDYLSMLGTFNIEANYDNKQKFTSNNKLETRLGFQTISSDSKHKFKTNADLLRMTNKIGIQATKHWYYTLMLQSWTQFYKTFNANSDDVTSDFMSPFETIVSLGMDYKLSKKKASLSATLSPIAINVKYCDRSAIVGRFGIDQGKHHKSTFGSTVTINGNVKFCDAISWSWRYYAFYDYKHLKMEWENTINLRVNKYLSTKLFLYPRFDNSVTKTEDNKSYVQFNEQLSISLNLSF